MAQDLAGSLFKHPLWQFSRPHTIFGTAISLVGILGVALSYGLGLPLAGWNILQTLGVALVSCLLANVYIVGLNQITDVAIDRINKPYLPLAQGSLTLKEAQRVVIFCLVAALGIALTQNIFLFATVAASILIGTAYSLPPLRLKRFPLWASFCIFVVRGLIVNLGLFGYFVHALDYPTVDWVRAGVLMGFMLVFSVVIALFKDIPDTVGDQKNNIQTFSLQWGRIQVFRLCIALLAADYLGMALGSGIVVGGLGRGFLVLGHGLLLWLLLWNRARSDLDQPAEFTRFYKFIWQLFYLEYLLFPLGCLLGNF
ncbi:homogentisate phytyltransferase [Anthocerotibacter panamensis]|uniref:homogentisate phytyltransferase n=1 Tax=Anthocerotibacter panamensis TaxID=2857077 RepID=UPI001FDA9EED|nr:homogentisate phytyltransferase [Anthocerotibacter panamensis]